MGGEFNISLKKNILPDNISKIPNLNSILKLGKCPQKMHLKRTITYNNYQVPVENYYKVKDKIYLIYIKYKTKDRNGKNTQRFFSIDLDLNVDYNIFPRDVEVNVMLELCDILLKSKIFDFYLGSGINGYDDIDNDGFRYYYDYPNINKYISDSINNYEDDFWL